MEQKGHFPDRGSGQPQILREEPLEKETATLQRSCLENPKDRGAWRAAVHGVTQSQTGLSDQTRTDSSPAGLRRKHLMMSTRSDRTSVVNQRLNPLSGTGLSPGPRAWSARKAEYADLPYYTSPTSQQR